MVGTKYVGSSYRFFLAQAVAITLEDAIVGLVRKVSVQGKNLVMKVDGYAVVTITPDDAIVDLARKASVQRTKVVKIGRYVWVFVWFSISTPWLINWMVGAGVMEMHEMIGVTRRVIEYVHARWGAEPQKPQYFVCY